MSLFQGYDFSYLAHTQGFTWRLCIAPFRTFEPALYLN
jgi:hypothetical protein